MYMVITLVSGMGTSAVAGGSTTSVGSSSLNDVESIKKVTSRNAMSTIGFISSFTIRGLAFSIAIVRLFEA
jgi:hypothetical protein